MIAGKTGSGKTYLARRLLAHAPRLVVLDPKGRLDDWQCEDASRDTSRRLAAGDPVRVRYRVTGPDDDDDLWTRALTDAYEAGDVVVYIDELYGVVEPGQRAPGILSAAYTRGREYGVGVWAATQRPTWIPLFALSESDHYFVFRLTLAEDRKRLAAFMGTDVETPITDPHGFFYARAVDDAPAYFERLQDAKGVTYENPA